jgi:hypothetical protein
MYLNVEVAKFSVRLLELHMYHSSDGQMTFVHNKNSNFKYRKLHFTSYVRIFTLPEELLNDVVSKTETLVLLNTQTTKINKRINKTKSWKK